MVVSIVGYNKFIQKAKISNDETILTQINNILKYDKINDESSNSMGSALKVVEQLGINVTDFYPTTDNYYYGYHQSNNQFVLIDDVGNIMYPKNEVNKNEITLIKHDDFKEYQYSEYDVVNIIKDSSEVTTNTFNKSIYVGDTNELTYNSTTSTLYSYSTKAKVSIFDGTYFEYGTVSNLLSISKGNLSITKDANINMLYLECQNSYHIECSDIKVDISEQPNVTVFINSQCLINNIKGLTIDTNVILINGIDEIPDNNIINNCPHEKTFKSENLPTCKNIGYKIYECQLCNVQEIKEFANKLEHEFDDWKKLDRLEHYHQCKNCESIVSEFHKFEGENDTCSKCGYAGMNLNNPIYIYNDSYEITNNKITYLKTIPDDTYTDLQQAIEESSSSSIIKLNNNVLLENNILESYFENDNCYIKIVGKEVNIDLNGYTMEGANEAKIFSVEPSLDEKQTPSVLNLYDSSINQTGKITSGKNVDYGAAITVINSTFNMYGGNIYGNFARKKGGGIYVYTTKITDITPSIFNMYGGTIANNHVLNEVYDSAEQKSVGGGLSIEGAFDSPTTFNSTVFNMYDGEIYGNSASSGGGISIEQGAIANIIKGNIGGTKHYDNTIASQDNKLGNFSCNKGGGIYAYKGTLNLSLTNQEVNINYNLVKNIDINDASHVQGGGVCLINSSINMQEGTTISFNKIEFIDYNEEVTTESVKASGAGLALEESSLVEKWDKKIIGGSITDNIIQSQNNQGHAGGIYCYGKYTAISYYLLITVSENCVIERNVSPNNEKECYAYRSGLTVTNYEDKWLIENSVVNN